MASGIDILVLGAGFAGFWAAVAARRVAASADIVLAARSPVLEMRPRLYEADPASLGVDRRPILKTAGVRFVEAEAI